MIISNGITDLTFLGNQADEFINVEQSNSRTASGGSRTIRAGSRFVTVEGIRVTGAEYKALIDLLLDGSSTYYYTPTVTPDFMESTDFPMAVSISPPKKKRAVGGGGKRYYVTMSIAGSKYL